MTSPTLFLSGGKTITLIVCYLLLRYLVPNEIHFLKLHLPKPFFCILLHSLRPPPGVNFTNVLRAAFTPVVLRQ